MKILLMKNKTFLGLCTMKRFILLFIMMLHFALYCTAQTEASLLYDLSFEQNINQTRTNNDKQHNAICAYQRVQMAELNRIFTDNVISTREGEVIVISIPASKLFASNDTTLTPSGKALIQKFTKYLRIKDMYRMLLVMRSDNTGSMKYLKGLTSSRVLSVMSYLETLTGIYTDYVIPYAKPLEDYKKDNNTMEGRALNRRLDIFLLPGDTMLRQANTGKVN